jgi:hypothetical protein
MIKAYKIAHAKQVAENQRLSNKSHDWIDALYEYFHVKRLCSRCSREITDSEYFNGPHFKGTCKLPRNPYL